MKRIRLFEETAGELFAKGEMPGFIHSSIGQESIAAGVCIRLRKDDYIVGNHRSHGHLIAKGAADIIMPDISKCGGLTGAWDIVRMARLWNVRVSPHVWSSAVSLAAGIQLSMSIPKYPHTLMEPEIYPWLEYDTSPNGLRTDILREPIEPNSSGYIEAPKGPGLGIELNWEAVEKYTIR